MGGEGNPEAVRYLNRLSDLLFILSRAVNEADESLWEPGAHGADRYAANKEGKTPSIAAEDNGFTALANILMVSKGWKQIYADDVAVAFVRDSVNP